MLGFIQPDRYVFVWQALKVENNSGAVGRAAGVEIVELHHCATLYYPVCFAPIGSAFKR
jgi:hypothetical protein